MFSTERLVKTRVEGRVGEKKAAGKVRTEVEGQNREDNDGEGRQKEGQGCRRKKGGDRKERREQKENEEGKEVCVVGEGYEKQDRASEVLDPPLPGKAGLVSMLKPWNREEVPYLWLTVTESQRRDNMFLSMRPGEGPLDLEGS